MIDGGACMRAFSRIRVRILVRTLTWADFVEAVQGYEDRVARNACELEAAFSQLAESSVNISVWFQYFAFDVMGELGFGESFNQVRTAKSHFETDFFRHGMSILALVTPVPWLYHLTRSLPGLPGPTKDWLALLSWSAQKAKAKIGVSRIGSNGESN